MPIVVLDKDKSRRVYDMVLAVRDAFGGRQGWKAASADLLAVEPAYVSKIVSKGGSQPIGEPVLRRLLATHPGLAPYFAPDSDANIDPWLRSWFDSRVTRSDVRQRTSALDETDCMAALARLDDDARARVIEWANKRWKR